MTRASNSVRAERINTALEFLCQCETLAEAAKALGQACGMSKRQAYRYLREAQMQGEPVPIPERKVAFTVKLPEGLIHQLRRRAALREQSLSQLVTRALDVFLRKDRGRGS
jgi:predicted DNA-binding transcriptional regulator YafY